MDGKANLSDIAVRSVYRGIMTNSCSCEDFLIPPLQLPLPQKGLKDVCKICQCGLYSKPECDQDGVTRETVLFTVIITTWFVTGTLFSIGFVALYAFQDKQEPFPIPRRQQDYDRIGENPATKKELLL
ncbi:hypothetical protein TNIN_381971 [Trichonephila inaurata madagascariensis]|uniref:Uncharacterized protein n=1 Tax=Trichonephila inaurata madagascariensis TaxID=2747483 RepID=A0A8X7CKC8_9ARAC|nr:hypothetical protein TNIN_381971 [Trichonephila inaurata madagascariensis]